MDGSILDLDGHDRVEAAHCGFERDEVGVFVRKYTKVSRFDAESNATSSDIFDWHKPVVALGTLIYKGLERVLEIIGQTQR